MELNKIVSRDEWLIARKAHLAREKELTKLRDQVSAERRELPWVMIEKNYVFDTPDGKQTLADLFGGRSQLVVYHFMFGPGWKEGCDGCSFLADHIDGANLHLAHHDVSLVVVSRAPLADLQAFKRRMGWRFKWVSSYGSDFNYDFHVTSDEAIAAVEYNYIDKAELLRKGEPWFTEGENHGLSVFYKNARGDVFHTYSTYARGTDLLIGAYNYLDLTPKGRNETTIMDWVRHHDRYEDFATEESCCGSQAGSLARTDRRGEAA
jgi:predicted dithiol-disulfide oxidoreductase (DUF899 family)